MMIELKDLPYNAIHIEKNITLFRDAAKLIANALRLKCEEII